MSIDFHVPESVEAWYDLLVKLCYDGDRPDPEVKHFMRRGGKKIPIRDYDSYRLLKSIDKVMYDQSRRICRYFEGKDD